MGNEYVLRIDLESKLNKGYAEYGLLYLGPEEDNFPIFFDEYSGNAGDSLGARLLVERKGNSTDRDYLEDYLHIEPTEDPIYDNFNYTDDDYHTDYGYHTNYGYLSDNGTEIE